MNKNQLAVLTAVRQWWLDNAYPPSVTDIAKKTGLSRNSTYRWLTKLEEQGVIRAEKGVARSTRLVGMEVVLPPLEELVARAQGEEPVSEPEARQQE